jgi:hypothetical protein
LIGYPAAGEKINLMAAYLSADSHNLLYCIITDSIPVGVAWPMVAFIV